jgi:hypothetical protein
MTPAHGMLSSQGMFPVLSVDTFQLELRLGYVISSATERKYHDEA